MTAEEKFVNFYIDSLTDEEQEKEFGISKKDFVRKEMDFVHKLRSDATKKIEGGEE